MNQIKIGCFLKELRNEKNMTQQQLADYLNVNFRTVSRWENAQTMPDFDLLIELSKLYDISIEELLNGERSNHIKQDDTMEHIVQYTNHEKERLLKNQHFFSIVGLVSWLIFLGLKIAGLDEISVYDYIASYAAGMAFAMSIVMVLYSSKHIHKISHIKKQIIQGNSHE